MASVSNEWQRNRRSQRLTVKLHNPMKAEEVTASAKAQGHFLFFCFKSITFPINLFQNCKLLIFKYRILESDFLSCTCQGWLLFPSRTLAHNLDHLLSFLSWDQHNNTTNVYLRQCHFVYLTQLPTSKNDVAHVLIEFISGISLVIFSPPHRSFCSTSIDCLNLLEEQIWFYYMRRRKLSLLNKSSKLELQFFFSSSSCCGQHFGRD